MQRTSSIGGLGTLAVLVAVTTPSAAVDEPLSRVQVARIGKAATALVEVKAARGQGYGSAFCVHPAGWFLTNAHVAQGELTLVLDSGLKTERAYTVRVVRSDADLDLALLRADGATRPAGAGPRQRRGAGRADGRGRLRLPLAGARRRAATAARRSASTRGASRPCGGRRAA